MGWQHTIRICTFLEESYHLSTPLTYQRFHLDAINLQPFLTSMLEGDAPEIDHDDVIWNCTSELIERVERYVEGYRSIPQEPVPTKIIKTVRSLQQLRPVCREIANSFDLYTRQTLIRPKNPIFLRKSEDAVSHCWPHIVKDIDLTLHDFNNRHLQMQPKFTQCTARVLENSVGANSDAVAKAIAELEDSMSKDNVSLRSAPSQPRGLERVVEKLPPLQPFQEDLVICDSMQLQVGDEVVFRFCGKQCCGRIVNIAKQMKAAYVSYNELPPCYNEYQPIVNVQSETAGGACRGRKKCQKVSCSVGGKGSVRLTCYDHALLYSFVSNICRLSHQRQNATILNTKCATFYLVRLKTYMTNAKIERWFSRDVFISKGN